MKFGELNSEKDIQNFFSNPANEKYFYISYMEYIRIFDLNVNQTFIPKINKALIYGHFQYYAFSKDELWYYQWGMVAIKTMLNTIRLKSTSFVKTVLFITVTDFFFEQYFLMKHRDARIFNLKNMFDYHLSKPRYQQTRQNQLNRYMQILRENHENKVISSKSKYVKTIELAESQDLYSKVDDKNEFMNKFDELKHFFSQHQHFTSQEFVNAINNTVQKSPQMIADFVEQCKNEFKLYKRLYSSFPKKIDFDQMLGYRDLDQQKVSNFQIETRQKIQVMIETFYYILTGKVKQFQIDLPYLKPVVQDNKKIKIRFPNSNPDILVFGLCITLPLHLIFLKKNYKAYQKVFKKKSDKIKYYS